MEGRRGGGQKSCLMVGSGRWEGGRDGLGRGGGERGSSGETPPLKVGWALEGTLLWPRAGFLLPGFTPQSPGEGPTIPTVQASLIQLHPNSWGGGVGTSMLSSPGCSEVLSIDGGRL